MQTRRFASVRASLWQRHLVAQSPRPYRIRNMQPRTRRPSWPAQRLPRLTRRSNLCTSARRIRGSRPEASAQSLWQCRSQPGPPSRTLLRPPNLKSSLASSHLLPAPSARAKAAGSSTMTPCASGRRIYSQRRTFPERLLKTLNQRLLVAVDSQQAQECRDTSAH